jgi:sulfatase-like protein
MSRARSALHLLALSSLAIAQPLFAKLGPAPGYFAAHHLSSLQVVLFALGVLLLPPLVLAALEALAGLGGERARRAVHLVFVAALVALIALPPLGALPAALAYGCAALIGVAAAAAYARWRPARSFTTALVVAPALFLFAFVALSPTSTMVFGDRLDAWRADDSFRPPVVFLQFDALPSLLLETPQRAVDAVRYPHFAQLARDGTWYRNASNVHENTVFSVPSIADGNIPMKGTHPVVQDHPQNLFTVLGPGYGMNVSEEATSLCPVEYCRRPPEDPGLRARVHSMWDDTRVVFNQIVRPAHARESLPSIRHRWTDFDAGPLPTGFKTRKKTPGYVIRHLQSGRIGRFERWLGRIGRSGARPELDYIHMFLPHEPREFLPDGRSYMTPDGALEGPPAYDKRFLNEQEEQRVQLQLGYTDRVVGRVIDKLKRLGIYDDAIIVVVADHGESFATKPTPAGAFVPGHLGYRRAVTRRNLADIGSIPMFIKYPKGHGPAGIDDRFVRDVDILPTIARVIGLPLAPVSGTPLQQPGYRGHREVQVGTTFDGIVRASVERWQAERQVSLRRRLSLFGSGRRSLYAFGPQAGLVARPVADFERLPAGRIRATIDEPERFRDVDPHSKVCPCQLAGRISGADPESVSIAVAVNGRIEATAQGFPAVGAKRLQWSAMIPPSSLRRGRNDVVIYRTTAGRLTPLS